MRPDPTEKLLKNLLVMGLTLTLWYALRKTHICEEPMLRIGDFSKLSRISIRMLRHYDEIGILRPESVDDFTEHDPDVEIQSTVVGIYRDTEHVKFKTVPPIQIASATYKGSYGQILKVNEAVADWVMANGYDFDGKSFCIYHVSPNQTDDPEVLVTEVCFPVRKK